VGDDMPGDSRGNGFDFSEFSELITQLEQLGADMDLVAEKVLDAGSEPARLAFQKCVPYDFKTPESQRKHEHARDHIVVSPTRVARRSKNKYRLISTDDGTYAKFKRRKRRSSRKRRTPGESSVQTDSTYSYLYFVEYGTVQAPARPFLEKAYREAQAAASEPMRQALIREVERYLEG